LRLTFLMVLNLVLMLGLSGCRTKADFENNSPLAEAAYETYTRYVRAIRGSGAENSTPDIPRECWAEGINKLKPIKVYRHRNNIVVTQKLRDNLEEGKYIYIPISSYLPMDGIDGFTLKPNPLKGNQYHLGDGIFDYKRTIKY